MQTQTVPDSALTPQILTVDVTLVPVGVDRLDLVGKRLEGSRRGWKFVLGPEEEGSLVRLRIHTAFTADVPYLLSEVEITDDGGPKLHVVDAPVLELPALGAEDDILLALTAVPTSGPQPKRRGGGSLIIRDAGGGG